MMAPTMIHDLIVRLYGEGGYQALASIVHFAPFWLPLVLIPMFWETWVRYIRLASILGDKYTLLEIKLPKEQEKSPLGMEIILAALYYTGGESTWIDRAWLGKVRPWWSLELVSNEGKVRFLIWTRTFLKNIIQSQLYAQYPNVEVVEVPDYTANINYDPKTTTMWGCYFHKDKLDAYPIKTYVDYGLDKQNVEAEEKTDPIATVLEYLSGAGKGEQIWIQILIRAHRREKFFPHFFKSTNQKMWKDYAQKEIDKVMKRDKKPPKRLVNGQMVEEQLDFTEFILTKGERTRVEAMERNIGKLPFDIGIRGIYLAKNENFNPINIPGLIGSFRQYATKDLNSLEFYDWTDFDYPWQDFRNMRRDYLKRKILSGYKMRSFFHPPYRKKHFVMSGEEVATIYHFPGREAAAPSLERITSRKATAPSNLPI